MALTAPRLCPNSPSRWYPRSLNQRSQAATSCRQASTFSYAAPCTRRPTGAVVVLMPSCPRVLASSAAMPRSTKSARPGWPSSSSYRSFRRRHAATARRRRRAPRHPARAACAAASRGAEDRRRRAARRRAGSNRRSRRLPDQPARRNLSYGVHAMDDPGQMAPRSETGLRKAKAAVRRPGWWRC